MAKKYTILLHSNYRPGSFGGIEIVANKIAETLLASDFSIHCFFGADDSTSEIEKERMSLISRRILFKLGGASFLSFGNSSLISLARRSDIIIFQEPYPTLWPAIFVIRRLLRKPVIMLVHANPVSHRFIMKTYGFIRSRIFSGSICVATSPNLLSQVESNNFLRSLVIPLCISDQPEQATYDSISSKLSGNYALYIGRLARYKGIEYLLEAARDCQEVNFVIAGDGPLAGFISDFISEFKTENVLFINRFVSEREKFDLIERSSFLLFPSVSQNEAFGLVQLEAMKSRKAIINTWINSGVNYVAPDLVCAITVPPKNSKQLAAAIKKLWNDIPLAIKLGQNGFDRFNSMFHEDFFRDSWKSLLKEMLNNPPKLAYSKIA